MRLIYSIFVSLYTAAITVASLFNERARTWVKGRKGWRSLLAGRFAEGDRIAWFHCASLGEFEQGRPVMEMLKRRDPTIKLVITFFSPSGYEIRKDYALADLLMYLPADSRRNARDFVSLLGPHAAIFIKYEFWYNYLDTLQRKGVPLYMVSGVFRHNQPFFRFYGGWFRKILGGFTHIFVQDKPSADILVNHGISNVEVSGDTWFDRVWENAQSAREIDPVRKFAGGNKVLVAGSSWPAEEEMICRYINEQRSNYRWIIAPHQVDRRHIDNIVSMIRRPVVRYSGLIDGAPDEAEVLVIDNIGILASVYRYGALAVVGGGFGKGIHNILEPASWGCPVLFGPGHNKFSEAEELIDRGGGFCFRDYNEFSAIIDKLPHSARDLESASSAAEEYVKSKLGATEIVVDKLHGLFLTG